MENDKSDSETSEIEVLPDELASSFKQMMVMKIKSMEKTLKTQTNFMDEISKSLQEIQDSLSVSGNNSSTVADQKIEREEIPSDNKCWNAEGVVGGTLEFGDSGLVTAKGSYGLIRAVNCLPLKEHGIVYFELETIDIWKGSALQIGISQKTMPMSTFYVFESAYELKNADDNENRKGLVIGCGVKFCAGKMFITRDGKAERTVELASLKRGDGVDQKLTIKLVGEGCFVHLGRIEMSDDESKCPF